MGEDKNGGFQELLQRLRDGKMLDHPLVKAHVHRALATGDQTLLKQFLELNPAILAAAERNITLIEAQKADHPFRPYPTRAEAAEHFNGLLKLGFINEYDDEMGCDPDDICKIIPCCWTGRMR